MTGFATHAASQRDGDAEGLMIGPVAALAVIDGIVTRGAKLSAMGSAESIVSAWAAIADRKVRCAVAAIDRCTSTMRFAGRRGTF